MFSLLMLFFLLGCASLSPRSVPSTPHSIEGCQAFFYQLDRQVEEAGVRNASDFLIPGFPYLRTNRFLAAMKDQIKDEGHRRFARGERDARHGEKDL